MITMTDKKFAKLNPNHAATCQNCDWRGHYKDLDPAENISARTEEGDTVWAGDCPNCGAMCFTRAEMERQNNAIRKEYAARELIHWTHVIIQRLEESNGILSETENTEIELARAAVTRARAAFITHAPLTK